MTSKDKIDCLGDLYEHSIGTDADNQGTLVRKYDVLGDDIRVVKLPFGAKTNRNCPTELTQPFNGK